MNKENRPDVKCSWHESHDGWPWKLSEDPKRKKSRPFALWSRSKKINVPKKTNAVPLAQTYQPVTGSRQYSTGTIRKKTALTATANDTAPRYAANRKPRCRLTVGPGKAVATGPVSLICRPSARWPTRQVPSVATTDRRRWTGSPARDTAVHRLFSPAAYEPSALGIGSRWPFEAWAACCPRLKRKSRRRTVSRNYPAGNLWTTSVMVSGARRGPKRRGGSPRASQRRKSPAPVARVGAGHPTLQEGQSSGPFASDRSSQPFDLIG